MPVALRPRFTCRVNRIVACAKRDHHIIVKKCIKREKEITKKNYTICNEKYTQSERYTKIYTLNSVHEIY